MNNYFRNHFLFFILLGLIISEIMYGQNLKISELKIKDKVWTAEEKEIIATVERFLFVAGNYNLNAMREMIVEKTIVGIVRLKDGKRITTTMTIEEYFEGAKK
jgi:hypothetical protein